MDAPPPPPPFECACDFCEAHRWAVRVLADPATPTLGRVMALELVHELAVRRARLEALEAAPRTRWGRARDRAAAWWERQTDGARRAVGWVTDEPAAVVASALWASLWHWITVAWALAVGGAPLRLLAVLAGVAFVVANRAGLRRLEGDR